MKNPKLIALFTSYAESHRHPMNRLTHKVAIPLIVFHIIAMLDWIVLHPTAFFGTQLTAAHFAYLIAMSWYLRMDLKLGLLMAILFGVCFPLGRMTPPAFVIAAAVVGWTIQLMGHIVYEKKQPAFMQNMVQTLVGPVFFVALLTGDWPQNKST